jgi:hypothetical protein
MRRIAVRMASMGTGGQAMDIGEVDDTGVSWGNGRGQLCGAGVQQLVALLGTGFQQSRFELVIGRQGLGGCEMSRVGGVLEFTYASTFLPKERPQ